jgi:hypothetical protein
MRPLIERGVVATSATTRNLCAKARFAMRGAVHSADVKSTVDDASSKPLAL